MKTRIAVLLLAGLLVVAPMAQAVGVAFAVLVGSLPFDPVIAVTPTGISVQYLLLCYDSITREKKVDVIKVEIPDNTPLAQHIVLDTDAAVAACAAQGVTVARNRVFFPMFQPGQ